MPRKCTICIHKDVDKLNKAICNNVSYRNIALQAGTSATTVLRHIDSCLKMELSTLHQERKTENAIDFEAELQKLYARATKMVDALEKWLEDPDDPGVLNIAPRDSEMVVTYLDYNDTTDQGKPKRKKGVLADLLQRAEAPNNIEAIAVATTAVDNRKLYLESFKTLGDRLEQIAKFHGLWTQDKTNPNNLDPFIATLSKWVDDHRRAGITLPAEEIADEAERLARANNVPPDKLIDAMSELVQ